MSSRSRTSREGVKVWFAFVLAFAASGCGGCGATNGAGDGGAHDGGGDGGDAGSSVGLKEAGAEDAGFDESALARPTEPNDALAKRMIHIVEAMAQDNPELAKDLLVPRQAFGALYDSKDATGAWDHKVKPGFERAIKQSRKGVRNPSTLKFVSFELGNVDSVSPKKKSWKYTIYRATKSVLTVSAGEKTRRIHISEMIGYRGAWYVVRMRPGR